MMVGVMVVFMVVAGEHCWRRKWFDDAAENEDIDKD